MRHFLGFLFFPVFTLLGFSQQPPATPNSDAIYRQLRDISLGSEATAVTNFILKRDAASFTFRQGTFAFLAPVNGKVTGAVFTGDGEFKLVPPIASEQKSISILTKRLDFGITEQFHTVVLRFTDNTYDEIKSAGGVAQNRGAISDALKHAQNQSRKTIKTNYDARILQDVLSSQPGGFFLAFIRGQSYSDKMLFEIDPHGAEEDAPEEISLLTYDENKYGIWASFHYSDEYAKGTALGTEANSAFDIEAQNLDTRIEKNGYLRGNALTTVIAHSNDLRALSFRLYPTLRVQKVTDAAGNPLNFVQEDKDQDADFWVILPKGLSQGEKFQLRTIYEGKDAVLPQGGGNYYPVARDDWYPNNRFGRYSTFELKFSTPKNIQLVATGTLLNQGKEGDEMISTWKSEVPLAVAGFNLGEFKKMDAKVETTDYTVESFANTNPPDFVQNIKHETEDSLPRGAPTASYGMGSMQTVLLMKKPLAEAQLSLRLYSDYFGDIPYKHIAMTQQTACNYGQSWPNLVYLPICAYFDTTVRHQLGLDDTRGYWKTVAPHEIAHQWWGHTVGFNGYRDQWMSEGFSEFSASLFVQAVMNNSEFQKIWKDQLELITEKNKEGFRPIDVGPLTQGYRLASSKAGFDIYRRLIYPKGAFVLHMLRMMMWDPKTKDQRFAAMMHEFVQTYQNRAASTEDFKAMVEKHMLPSMDLQRNHKMDWFFEEYVYGTALPNYTFESSIGKGENGAILLTFKLTQSNVTDGFRMLVPIYLDMGDGRVFRLGSANMQGNNTVEQTVPLNGLKDVPKRAIINYQYDVLATGY